MADHDYSMASEASEEGTTRSSVKPKPKKAPKRRPGAKARCGKGFNPDGSITIVRKEGKARSDAYGQRAPSVVQACDSLHKITGAEISLRITPTWPKGKTHWFKSPGCQSMWASRRGQDENENDQEEAQPSTSQAAAATSTPPRSPSRPVLVPVPVPVLDKRSVIQKKKEAVNMCQMCKVYFNSAADKALKGKRNWVRCSKSACSYWVHAACCGIKYPATSDGQAELGEWSKDHFFCPKHI